MLYRKKFNIVFLVLLVIDFSTIDLLAQNVNYSERHSRLRKAGATIVLDLGNRLPEHAVIPLLEATNQGHYHFRSGHHAIYCGAFWELGETPSDADFASAAMIDARLRIEWFWKWIPMNQRKFWTPYIVEAAREIADAERMFEMQSGEERRAALLLLPTRLDTIWERGAEDYAKQHGLELKLEEPPPIPCVAAEPVTVKLVPAVSNRKIQISHIEWSAAAPVWRAMIDGREPTSYQAISVGGEKEVHIGAIYYYRFIIGGQPTKQRISPDVPRNGGIMRLPFTEQ